MVRFCKHFKWHVFCFVLSIAQLETVKFVSLFEPTVSSPHVGRGQSDSCLRGGVDRTSLDGRLISVHKIP